MVELILVTAFFFALIEVTGRESRVLEDRRSRWLPSGYLKGLCLFPLAFGILLVSLVSVLEIEVAVCLVPRAQHLIDLD